MPQNRRTQPDFQETSALVPIHDQGGGAYSFVSPKRSRKAAAVIVDPPLETEFQDDIPTRDFLAPASRGTPSSASLNEAVERAIAACEPVEPEDLRKTRELAPLPKPEAYHDPELCSCDKMTAALASKLIMVVVAGPVSLAPAVLREDTLLAGDFDLDAIERAYDGKPWAFRHCPFEGCLIDAQVEIIPQEDPMTCCGTMALAVAHGRVELPEPTRIDRSLAKFTDAGRPGLLFFHCPWCATEMIDLVIARHKRHLGL